MCRCAPPTSGEGMSRWIDVIVCQGKAGRQPASQPASQAGWQWIQLQSDCNCCSFTFIARELIDANVRSVPLVGPCFIQDFIKRSAAKLPHHAALIAAVHLGEFAIKLRSAKEQCVALVAEYAWVCVCAFACVLHYVTWRCDAMRYSPCDKCEVKHENL